MSGFRLLKSDVKRLTPELAKHFQELKASPTERELNPGRVDHLREKAKLGQLVSFHWSTARLGGEVLRMNGQHSSAMLTGLNGAFPEGLQVHLDEYEVDTQQDLAVLFQQFDDRKSSRTSADVSGAYQGLYPEVHGISRGSAKLAIDGVAWYRPNVEGIPVPSGDYKYGLFGEPGLQPFVKWISEIFDSKTKELQSTYVVAAMYATYLANETEAKKFWHQVARGGIEYEDQAPSTVLDEWLKRTKEDKDFRFRANLKPGNYYQACIYAWNASREDRTIKDIKSDSKKGFAKPIE